MVARDYIRRSALGAYRRWRTVMAWAMLRALGVPCAYPAAPGEAVTVERYAELSECMANRESPLDGRTA